MYQQPGCIHARTYIRARMQLENWLWIWFSNQVLVKIVLNA
ncbi:hypothetical protein [Chitinophaga jiangningensis]|nr:hypothetical protein [Chitinophaga jiangningensis]